MKQWKFKRLHKYVGFANNEEGRWKTSYNSKRSTHRPGSVNQNYKNLFKRTASMPDDKDHK